VKKTIAGVVLVLLAAATLAAKEQERRTLAVTGTAEVSVAPDICYMGFTVETRHKSAVEAYAENNRIMKTVNAAIKAEGIQAKDMSTSNFSIQPVYRYEDRTNRRIFEGYRVTHTLNVKVRELSKVSKVLDAAVNAGATGVQNVTFTVENPKKYTSEARIEAIKAARKKAEVIAKHTGVTLGKPISIRESEPGSYLQPQTNVALDGFSRTGGIEASLEPGEIKLSHTVYITYEIE